MIEISLRPDFHADMRAQILANLPYKASERQAVEALSLDQLLIAFLNWCGRFVSAAQRRVHVSSVLGRRRPLASGLHEAALVDIIAGIEQGRDLSPYLSRGVKHGIVIPKPGPKKLGRRRDLDLMLNDWGVHHLHLSSSKEADGFVSRTKAVLFAVFHKADAYLLDVVDHGAGERNVWTRQHILEIMAREWPEEQLLLELKGVFPGTNDNESERHALRRAGVATQVGIDGKVYISRTGLSTAGTSSQASLEAGRILNHVRSMEKDLRLGSGPTWATLLRSGRMPLDPGALRFLFVERGYGLFDERGQVFYRMAG